MRTCRSPSAFPGSALIGLRYEPPFDFISAPPDYGEKGHTVLAGDFVTAEDGTGLVHTAIAFGEDDFRLGEENGLEPINPVLPDGTYDERISTYAGRKVKDCDEDIVEALRAAGKLLKAVPYEHSYPHCWRCDTACSTTPSRRGTSAPARSATACWPPTTRSTGSRRTSRRPLRQLPGRQRGLGALTRALLGHALAGMEVPRWAPPCGRLAGRAGRSLGDAAGRPAPAVRRRGHLRLHDRGLLGDDGSRAPGDRRLVRTRARCRSRSSAPPTPARRSSSRTSPADYICEAIDQTRGWFYSMLAVSTLLFDTTSFRNCVCLGLILDENGAKMSKSRGNTVEPWDVINTFGADAFPWYLFASKYPWDGYRFSLEALGEAVRQSCSSSGTRTGSMCSTPTPTACCVPPWTTSSSETWTAGCSRGWRPRPPWSTRRWTATTRPPRTGDGRVRRRPLQLVRARSRAASGTATGPRSRRCTTCW